MRFRLATWNINSVRLRVDLVSRFAKAHRPDVICLQEIKCVEGKFPELELRALGFPHIAVAGQKGYHGVAVVARVPFDAIDKRGFCGKADARHIRVTFGEKAGLRDPLHVHNFYVPAGGDEPDPEVNPKFEHKLSFLDEMKSCGDFLPKAGERAIVVGDLNVAPLEHDVWSHKALLNVVSHTPVEVDALTRLQQAHAWVDIGRRFVPAPERNYTWWSYRSPDWTKNDRGRRLDHMWVSPEASERVVSHRVLEPCRSWQRPSDHVPLICEVAV